MAFKILLATYLVVAVAMILFILMQRGAGAQAGSGFGAGASGTVFGASGSANFLSISTKWLAVGFFAISIGMGWYVSYQSRSGASTDLGVIGEVEQPTETNTNPVETAPANIDVEVPESTSKPAAGVEVPVPASEASSEVPAAGTAPGEVEKAPKN